MFMLPQGTQILKNRFLNRRFTVNKSKRWFLKQLSSMVTVLLLSKWKCSKRSERGENLPWCPLKRPLMTILIRESSTVHRRCWHSLNEWGCFSQNPFSKNHYHISVCRKTKQHQKPALVKISGWPIDLTLQSAKEDIHWYTKIIWKIIYAQIYKYKCVDNAILLHTSILLCT